MFSVVLVLGFVSFYPISLGFLLFPSMVFGISFILIGLLVSGIMLFGDKVLLSLMQARPLPKGHYLEDVSDHYSFLFQQENKKIYIVDGFDNCFLFRSLFGKTTLVFESALLEKLSSKEMESIIFLSCVKSRGSKLFLSFSFQMFKGLFYFPTFFLPKKSQAFRSLNVIISFFLFPLRLVEVFAFKRGPLLLDEDFEVFNKIYLGKELSSAYFKIEHLYSQNIENKDGIFERVIEGLAILEDNRYDALRTVLGPRLLSKARFKALIHEKFSQKCDKVI